MSLRELLALILNRLSQAERQTYLAGAPTDKGNGSYPRSLKMGSIPLQIDVPRTRGGSFRPRLLPPSNGKIERGHKSLKGECLRPGVPGSAEEPRSLVAAYVDHYNRVRLHIAMGYVTPLDKLEGRAEPIWAERDRKLEEARRMRQLRRQQAAMQVSMEQRTTGGAPAVALN